MQISEKKIEELQILYKNNYGIDLTKEETILLGTKLVLILEIICLESYNKIDTI